MTPVILVVDDDPDDQELLREAFADIGFEGEVACVDDGDTLLASLEERVPHLVLLDLHMPRLHGLEALKQLRAKHPALPVVVMTTSWSEEDIAQSYTLGANSFIIKPVLYDELMDAARGLVQYWFELSEIPPPPRRGG